MQYVWPHGMQETLLKTLKVVTDFALAVSTITIGVLAVHGVVAIAETGGNAADLRSWLEIFCPLLQICLLLSPIPLVLEAVKTKNAQDLPLQVFLSQAACNVLGLAYAIQSSLPVVVITNLFGLCCQITYLAGEHSVRTGSTGWWKFWLKLILILNGGIYVSATCLPLRIVGDTMVLANIITFASPLVKLGTVLRTRNASSLPTGMTMIACVNNAAWSAYSLLIKDMVLFMPSILGLMLTNFQMMLILWSWQRLPFDMSFLQLLVPMGNTVQKDMLSKGDNEKDLEKDSDSSPNDKEMHILS